MITIYILPAGKTLADLNIEESAETIFTTLDGYPAIEQDLVSLDDEIQIIIFEPEKVKIAKQITAVLDKNTNCWLCNSHASNPNGYKRFTRNNRPESVHRYVYKYFYDDPGPNIDVCHSCDTRACCNPYHLSAETHPENMRQMVERGRSTRGERHGQSKLTENDVIAILADNVSKPKEIALRYGVSTENIRQIKRGELWKHINRDNIIRITGAAV